MKNKIHSLIVEGIVFCGSGLVLLSYSLSSYAKGFNKSWAQSPYLFPLIVALAMIGLSLWIVGEGVTAMKKEAAVPNDKKVSKEEKTEKRRWVVIALILCALLCSTCFYKSSVCDHRNFIFCVHIFNI